MIQPVLDFELALTARQVFPLAGQVRGAAGGGPASRAVGANEDIRDDSADVGEVSDNPTLGYPYS